MADPLQDALDYARGQLTTGFLVVREGEVLARANWPAPADAGAFHAAFAYETNAAGELLEDVASLQKSVVALLCAIAADRGLLAYGRPVSHYIGPGWSKAPDEAAITVDHLLTMTSGLDERFEVEAAPGARFFYNTPVYAVLKRLLTIVAGRPLEDLTRDWLAAPAGLADTAWRPRPAALADVGNPTGLVTGPTDMARIGQLVLDGGRAADGTRVVSEAGLAALFERTTTNPAYGRLWWLNGGAFTLRAPAQRVEGPLIPSAPRDTIVAIGHLARRIYVVPSLQAVIVRPGQAPPDPDFDDQLWRRLAPALGQDPAG